MDDALTIIEKTQVNEDFRVSTVLFSNRFETRVFCELDELPDGLVKIITYRIASLITHEKTATSVDTGERFEDDYDEFDEDYDDYEPEEFVSGVAVDSFGFSDANSVHEHVVASVRTFVEGHKRIVSYV
jgi:hypothetical protein